MEVREKILLEATRLFAERGFEGTSLSDVADAVGVRKPSLLYHFASKEEIRRAVLERLLARWNDVLPRLLMASQATGLAKFEAVTGEVFEFFAADPDRARLIMREILDRPKEMKDLAERLIQPWVEIVTRYIELGKESGQIRADVDAEVFILQITSMSLAAIAAGDAFTAILPSAASGSRTGKAGPPAATNQSWPAKKKPQLRRIIQELVRMAKTSLFEPSYLQHLEKQRKQRKGAS